jgi:preprotein translocase subunit SecA
VILTERHEAGRIDRQVEGRCGRQGESGSVEAILSWEDPLVAVFGGWRGRWHYGGVNVFARAQGLAERLHARARLDLLRHDQRRDEKLTFTGSVE